MKAKVTSIDVEGRGRATLVVEVDLTNTDYERNIQMMDSRYRQTALESDEYRAYLAGLEKKLGKLHVGEVEITFPSSI